MYMKWILMLLIISCTGSMVKLKERTVRDKVTSMSYRGEGLCRYTVEPRNNYSVIVVDKCGTYIVGDSLTRTEIYTVRE